MGRVLATARTPAFDMPGGTRRIGLAWLTTEQDSVRMVWHNGGTGGYRTFLGLDEQARRGVVVLSNQQFSVDDIGGHLVNSRVPLAKVTARVVRTAITLPAATLDRYVGSYQLAPAFTIDITREGSSLFAQATGQGKLEIFAEAEGKFFFKAVDAQLTFASDTSGKAPSVTLHQNGRDVPGPRIR
jgi:D-alanyl-D-alanine-carboxypeptidase/D-alanyl-D-alanine-endopeptidase